MLLVDHDTIRQLYSLSEDTCQNLTQQVYVMSFQILIYELAWNLDQQSLGSRLVRLEYNRTKPSVKLLLGHILLYELEATIPKIFRTDVHVGYLNSYAFR